MLWSKYQLAAFDFNISGEGNMFLQAVAGSGKSTVIEKMIMDCPVTESILAIAFAREIKKHLEAKLAHYSHVTVKTLNGFGSGICYKAVRRRIKLDEDKTQNTMFFDVMDGKKSSEDQKNLYYKSRWMISKIIAIWKADMVWEPRIEDMFSVMDRFNLNIPKKTTEVQIWSLAEVTYKKSMAKTLVMDWDDQIAMPLFHNWEIPTYDRVYGDESQDFTPAQIELVRRAIKQSDWELLEGGRMDSLKVGRAFYVGDERQSIMQFRGADSNAVQNIIDKMHCTELPLSICYRCSKAVIRDAQVIVPHIEASETAIEGLSQVVTVKDFYTLAAEGDMVLGRCTAPLVEACMEFIRQGRKAQIKGREIGQQLIDFIEEVADSVEDITIFDGQLCEHVQKQEEKLKLRNNQAQLLLLNDTFETIVCLYAKCDGVSGLKKLISEIFSDHVQGIMLMTIHKSKGLQNPKVFIIAPELLPHKLAVTDEQKLSEENLLYVGITRAQSDIYYVDAKPRMLEPGYAFVRR